jgi:hypothetical protein
MITVLDHSLITNPQPAMRLRMSDTLHDIQAAVHSAPASCRFPDAKRRPIDAPRMGYKPAGVDDEGLQGTGFP